MKIIAGQNYDLLNIATNQRAQFQCSEVSEYKGQYMVFGSTTTHEVRVVRGVMPTKARLASFVIFPQEPKETTALFVDVLKGRPIVLLHPLDPRDVLCIVNMGKLKGIWDGRNTHSAHLDKCAKVIDLYWDWRDSARDGGHHTWPAWFREAKVATKLGISLN